MVSTAELVRAAQEAKKKERQNSKKYDKYAVRGKLFRMTNKQIRYAMFLAKHYNVTFEEVVMNFDEYAKRHREEKEKS